MATAYREGRVHVLPVDEDVRWRRRTRLAGVLVVPAIALKPLVLFAAGGSPPVEMTGSWLVNAAAGVVLALVTLMFAAPRPNARSKSAMSVVLRLVAGLLLVTSVLETLLPVGVLLSTACTLFLLPLLLAHLSSLFRDLGRPFQARAARNVAILFLVLPILTAWLESLPVLGVSFAMLLLGYGVLFVSVLATLHVKSVELWYDAESGQEATWAAMEVLGDGGADVLTVNEHVEFRAASEARGWLEARGFLPASVAVQEGAVHDRPPA